MRAGLSAFRRKLKFVHVNIEIGGRVRSPGFARRILSASFFDGPKMIEKLVFCVLRGSDHYYRLTWVSLTRQLRPIKCCKSQKWIHWHGHSLFVTSSGTWHIWHSTGFNSCDGQKPTPNVISRLWHYPQIHIWYLFCIYSFALPSWLFWAIVPGTKSSFPSKITR